jgi:hypothetical protein
MGAYRKTQARKYFRFHVPFRAQTSPYNVERQEKNDMSNRDENVAANFRPAWGPLEGPISLGGQNPHARPGSNIRSSSDTTKTAPLNTFQGARPSQNENDYR